MSYDFERTPEQEAQLAAEHAAEVKHCEAVAEAFPSYGQRRVRNVKLAKLIQHERSEAIVQKLLAVCEEHDRFQASLAAADRLVALIEAYNRDVTEDPDGSLWVARQRELDSALSAYHEARR